MRDPIALVLTFLLLTGTISLSLAETYDCTIEKEDGMEICVFRSVKYFKNTTHIAFYHPSGSSKPENVAFIDSQMVALPPSFLTAYGNDLKVLKVENSELQTVVVTKNMEALHVRNNYIRKVLTYQNHRCDNLKTLDISMNRLENVDNITSCVKLETLDLSGNERLWRDSTLDLTVFEEMGQLQSLNVSNTGVLYMENSKERGLPLLQTIDLSKNDILPVDFRIEIFYPFKALETLWLNDNSMTSIDYAYLLNIESLKTVYLNGNNFQCMKIKDMIDFLNSKNINTPTDRHSNCPESRNVQGMCCTGPMPTNKPRPRPTPPGTPVTTQKTTDNGAAGNEGNKPETVGETDEHVDNGGNGGSSHHWIIGASVVTGLIATATGGFVWYKKRHHH